MTIDVRDEAYLERCRNEIYTRSHINGYSFIIDGTHFKLAKAPNNISPSMFYNRKGFKSLAAQVVIDPFFKVVQLDAGYSGNINDVTMYNQSSFRSILMDLISIYGEKYCCIGDNGYPIRKEMLTPYTGVEILSDLSEQYEKEMFSRIISSVRQSVERIFGILQRKWNLLVIGCEYNTARYIDFIYAIFGVHNYMLAEEDSYKMNIMNSNWEYAFNTQSLENCVAELDSIWETDELFIDGEISALREGECKRDIVRRGLLRQDY